MRAATCAGVVALGALLSAPAQAAAAAPLRVETDDLMLGAGSSGKVASVDLYNTSGADQLLRNFTISVDTTGLAGKVTLEARSYDNCTRSGSGLTCVTPSFKLPDSPLATYALFFDVRPTAQATAGDQGTLKVSVSAEGLPTQEATGTIAIGDSIDLTTARDLSRTGKPGGTVTFPLAVRNAGRVPARGVVLSHSRSTRNVEYDRKYSNCLYTADQMACVFPEELAPGKEYELAGAITTKVRADAPAPFKYDTYFEWQTRDDAAGYLERLRAQQATTGSGAPLALTEKTAAARVQGQTEVKPTDNFAKVAVTIEGSNTADQIAVGGVVRGAVGSTVKAKAGIRNAGPARVDHSAVYKFTSMHFVVPSNASIVSAPTKECVAAKNGKRDPATENPVGARELLCWGISPIEVGQTVSWEIGLRVDQAEGTAGAVIVEPDSVRGEPTLDRDASNNRAELVVALPLPPAAGTGGAGAARGGAGAGTDGLPVTGAQAGTFAAVGVVLLAAGVAGFVLARRRRTRFTA